MSPARSRPSSRCFAATSAPTGSGRARSSSPSRRRTASRPSSSRSTSTASTSSSSARRASRLADARASLEQALDLVRGEVLEDEPYATWALDLRGSYQGRVLGAHLDAADAALAELDFAPALGHAEAASDARPLQRTGAPLGDARSLCARSSARSAQPLPQLPPAARRGARPRADGGDACARGGGHPPGGRPGAAATTDPRATRAHAGGQRPSPARPRRRARDAHRRDPSRDRRRRLP